MGWLKNAGRDDTRYPAQKSDTFCPLCGAREVGGDPCQNTDCVKIRADREEAVATQKAAEEKTKAAEKAAQDVSFEAQMAACRDKERSALAGAKAAYTALSPEGQALCRDCIEWSRKNWDDPENAPMFSESLSSALDWAEHIT